MNPSTTASVESASPTGTTPVIKGVFVNSHVAAVRRALGDEGVQALEDRYGAPVSFGPTEDVPVREEVRIIELALDLLRPDQATADARAFEAGRLHFRNFTTTPWAKILFRLFPRNYHYMTTHAHVVAERVFKGVEFEPEDLGPQKVRLTMRGADYPIDHFRGLFYEWMRYFDLTGDVTAAQAGPGEYVYTMQWEAP